MTQEEASLSVVYSWQAELEDGTLISEFDPPQGEPTTLNLWGEVPQDQVVKLHLIPRFNMTLPQFTLDKSSGVFYRKMESDETPGHDMPLAYPESYNPETVTLSRLRKVVNTIEISTFNSSVPEPRRADPSLTYFLTWVSIDLASPIAEFGLKISYKGLWEEFLVLRT